MNYQETVNWMFGKLPVYQFQGASAYKEDLTNSLKLCEYLGNPERKIRCIHVAGTNGKGSTSHLLASVLQEAGYKVGLYTSPHLKDFRERIKINGNEISEEYVCQFIAQHKDFFETTDLSFFEMTVGLAFDYFAHEKVEIAVIEVGLGGRLDATNIISPLISVITNIGIDHTAFLGNTIAKIATEKAGIIKPNIPVVIGEYTDETKIIFSEKATRNKSKIFFASDLISSTFPSALLGNYQKKNKKTVVQTLRVLVEFDAIKITEDIIKIGFENVIVNTKLQGRWQELEVSPKTICDTAHNAHGLEIVLSQVKTQKYDTLHIVLGFVNDKNMDDLLPLFPKEAIYYFCQPANSRALDATQLQTKAAQYNLIGSVYNSVTAAYQKAREMAHQNDFIYIGGSNFIVSEIL
jgi:dihydrofolate synthase/folylpolyglutamate synthase